MLRWVLTMIDTNFVNPFRRHNRAFFPNSLLTTQSIATHPVKDVAKLTPRLCKNTWSTTPYARICIASAAATKERRAAIAYLGTQHLHFATRAVAEATIREFIAIFCNRQRHHSRLGYLAPAVFAQSYWRSAA